MSKSAKHAYQYATKERPVKIAMYLGLDIIIKIKFTTIFGRCAILNVLNYFLCFHCSQSIGSTRMTPVCFVKTTESYVKIMESYEVCRLGRPMASKFTGKDQKRD